MLLLVRMIMLPRVMVLGIGGGDGADVGMFEHAHARSYRGTFRFSQMPTAMVISNGRTIR